MNTTPFGSILASMVTDPLAVYLMAFVMKFCSTSRTYSLAGLQKLQFRINFRLYSQVFGDRVPLVVTRQLFDKFMNVYLFNVDLERTAFGAAERRQIVDHIRQEENLVMSFFQRLLHLLDIT